MLAAAVLLKHAAAAVMSSQAALCNTAAVSGLASALASLVKRAVQFTKGAVEQQRQLASTASPAQLAAAYFPSALVWAYKMLQLPSTQSSSAVYISSSGNSSSSSQSSASTALLLVVLARGACQLADAMQVAGPETLLQSLLAAPTYFVAWGATADMLNMAKAKLAYNVDADATSKCAQELWQYVNMPIASWLWRSLATLGVVKAGSQAEAAAAAVASSAIGGAQQPTDAQASSSCTVNQANIGSSSSSSSELVRWGYLLQLQQASSQWAAAMQSFTDEGFDKVLEMCTEAGAGSSADRDVHNTTCQRSQLLEGAMQLLKALAAAAPLPVVCNNPSCKNLAAMSEAAAAGKRCASCRCRYCSVACQQADWRRHKHACRRMAAAGEVCG
jgi:hypothetical protein